MLPLLLLTLVLQGPKPAAATESLSPQVMAALVKAAERVAAIGQSAVVCQAELAADRTRIDALRKEHLTLVEKVSGLDRDIAAARERQRGKSTGSPEYTSAARDIVHATTTRTASTRRGNDIASEESQLAKKVKGSEACVSKAKAELEALKR